MRYARSLAGGFALATFIAGFARVGFAATARITALVPETKAVFSAQGETSPFVATLLDAADGTTSVSPKDAGANTSLHSLIDGATWQIYDNDTFQIGRMTEVGGKKSFQPLLSGTAKALNNDKTFFVIHLRTADRLTYLNGTIGSFPSDPSNGNVEFFVVDESADGKTARSTYALQDLTVNKQ